MGLFRRKKGEDDVEDLESEVDASAVDETSDERPSTAAPRPTGPWDEGDAPDDDVQRLDLGGLRVPTPPQTEMRVEMSPEGQVTAVTLVRAASAMQVSAFAAPRTEGIWDEVREEIATSLREGGGQADEGTGPWGTELRATVPTQAPGQGRMLAPARFVGVNGPRWFLRAMFTGPAATDASAARDLEAALSAVVVVRGSDPMAVRDPLPLQLPKDVQEAAQAHQRAQQAQQQGQQQAQQRGQQQGAQPQGRPAPQVPERGPEITEIR